MGPNIADGGAGHYYISMKERFAARVRASGKVYELLYGRKAMGRIWLARLFSRGNLRRNEKRLEEAAPSGLLTRQGAGALTDRLRFGISSMKRSGCEVMAAYNVLSARGRRPDLPSLISEFERKGASLGGFFGASPYAVADILREKGLSVRWHGRGEAADFDALLRASRLGVLSFWWGGKSLVIHTVMLDLGLKGEIRAWNFASDAPYTVFSTIEDMIKRRDIVPICLITAE